MCAIVIRSVTFSVILSTAFPQESPHDIGLLLLQTTAKKLSQKQLLNLSTKYYDEAAEQSSAMSAASDVQGEGPHLGLIASIVKRWRDIPMTYDHIEVDATYTTVWGEIATFPERRPRTFNLLMATTKSWLADAVVQMRVNKHFDWNRSAAFAAFGFVYVGIMQWFIYVTVLAYLFPHAVIFANEPLAMKYRDVAGQIDLVKQVVFDTFLVQVFIYYPFFYLITEIMKKEDTSTHETPPAKRIGYAFSTVHRVIQKYQRNFWNDNLLALCVWIPSDFIVFAAPMYLRLPLDHMLSFFWTCLLSYLRGGTK
jgi:hypothetical protein